MNFGLGRKCGPFLAVAILWGDTPALDGFVRAPYLTPADAAETEITTLLSAGDGVDGYRLGGTPDGLAARRELDGTLSLWVAHAFATQTGIPRAHGARGAYLSHWTLETDAATGALTARRGADFPHHRWEAGREGWQRVETPRPFARLNGLDLPPAETFWDREAQVGTQVGLLLGGEEDTDGGAAFAHVLDGPDAGSSWELPVFGALRYENLLAQPSSGTKTYVIGISDRAEGFLVLYVGEKRAEGNSIERAGLADGQLFVLATSSDDETAFRWVPLPDWNAIPTPMQDMAVAEAGPRWFARPKDGQWHPTQPGTFYFTSQGNGRGDARVPSRLYRLTLDDPANPLAGGQVAVALEEGSAPFVMLDSMTIDQTGDVWLQENPGKGLRLAHVYRFTPENAALEEVAAATEHHFHPDGASYITAIEEATGIIDLSPWLGAGHLLTAFHSHRGVDDPTRLADAEARELFGWSLEDGRALVEDGQLLLISPQ